MPRPSRHPLWSLAAALPVVLLPVVLLPVLFLPALFLITACDRARPPVPAATPSPTPRAAPTPTTATASPVGFTMQTFTQTDGDCATPEGCATVSLQVPEIVKAPSAAAREALQRFIRDEWLASSFGTKRGDDLALLAREIFSQRRSFLAGHAGTPGRSATWWVRRGIDIVYQDDRVVSLRYGGDSYTGGEHPVNEILLASFDPATGRRLALADLFAPGSEEALRTLAAARYRQLQLHHGPPETSLQLEGRFAVVEAGLLVETGTEPSQIVLTRAELAEVLKKDGPLARAGRPRAYFPSPLGSPDEAGGPGGPDIGEPAQEPLGTDLGSPVPPVPSVH